MENLVRFGCYIFVYYPVVFQWIHPILGDNRERLKRGVCFCTKLYHTKLYH